MMDISNTADGAETFVSHSFGPHELEELAHSQLEHALDARRRGLKIYESLKSLDEVIGAQYGDRVLFELLQNAHDAHDAAGQGEISVRLLIESDERGELLVANRGRGFSFSNLDAIRNIGTSDKEIGEGIGNKGLGFRSVEALTDDVRIYSQDENGAGDRFRGYCFRFASTEEIETRLEPFGAPEAVRKEVASNISRYLIPLSLSEQPDEIVRFARAGFATVVALPLQSADTVRLAHQQILALASPDTPILLFLERIRAVEIEIRRQNEPLVLRRLTRKASNIANAPATPGMTLERVEVGEGEPFLVVRRVLPKSEVLKAVQESIPTAPPLKRWLKWKGEATVSVAVPLEGGSVNSPRLFNFLPMDQEAAAPIAGYIDAPFFAEIDRRSIRPDLPLNRYLLDASAKACAAVALTIVECNLPVSEKGVLDLVTWMPPHVSKIIAAFAAIDRPLGTAEVWPIVSGGRSRWASLDDLYAWPDVSTKFLKPDRLATVLDAAILPGTIGDMRLSRVRALAAAVYKPIALTGDVLCEWTTKMAEALVRAKRWRPNRWRDLYDDVVALFAAGSVQLNELEGRRFLISNERRLLVATATGSASAPPVFVRAQGGRSRKREGPPLPPGSLSRRLKFLHDGVSLAETTLRALEKADLLRRYDPVEILKGLAGALGASPRPTERQEALIWAFRVWQFAGDRLVEEALRNANLFVPTLSGWAPASEALFSATWTNAGKLIEPYLYETAGNSSDCARQRDRLLISFSDWPLGSSLDKKSDWVRFLELLAVRDGLQPIAGNLRRRGNPTHHWHPLFLNGDASLGLTATWTAIARKQRLSGPYTDYLLEGECWRLPGQLEHGALPQSAREILSELIVDYLREWGDQQFQFAVRHWRGGEQIHLPTPLQIFLQEAEWVASVRRDVVSLRTPRQCWSTQVARQIPPRFVERFAAEPGHRGSAPPLLFDSRIGLRDWTKAETAPERLVALAAALSDLSASERRDLRDQLRRAWSDIAESALPLPDSLPLVVERSGGLEICEPNKTAPQVIHLSSERQGFAARALVDQGEAVLDVGEVKTAAIQELLQRTGAFLPRLADAGDVRLLVDGTDFQPSGSDPFLVSGELDWLSDAAALAHEFLGDPLELRTLPPEALDQRTRQIRIRRCNDFALLVGDHEVSARGRERVQPFPHPRLPTLVVSGSTSVDLDVLIEAAPALTKLVGARRNTLEMMLTRLMRHGFRFGGRPTEDQYARAVLREVEVIRDHFAATHGGIERRVRVFLPILSYLRGREVAHRLSERHEQLGPLLKLREWLTQELGDELSNRLWSAVNETEDQAQLRRRLGFDFAGYNATLAELGYPLLNDEEDFRRLFEVYLNELRPALVNRVRRRHLSEYQQGGSLTDYLAHKRLDFVTFDPAWPLSMEELDRSFVETYASGLAEVVLGPDEISVELPDLKAINSVNQKMVATNQKRMASIVRAWCRKNDKERPTLLDPADPWPLVRAIEQAGLFDFERLTVESLPSLCGRIGAWPTGMPLTFLLEPLQLAESDLDFEEREARDARRQAEVTRRTITFSGKPLDTGAPEFEQLFADLADAALAAGADWYARSRPPRLAIQEQQRADAHDRGRSHGAGKGQRWRDQPPEAIRRAMGIASEYLAREYLRRRHPREMSDQCWVSSNRSAFCSDGGGDDSLGYDFRVVTARNEWLYEVKSALDEGGEFELTARELEVAGSSALDRKRRYRILYVPHVFDPDRWCVLPLQNPAGERTRNRFRVIRTSSVRYGFDRK
jgi:anti-sigma regulatory factor (Ser/Thr protein kinase)